MINEEAQGSTEDLKEGLGNYGSVKLVLGSGKPWRRGRAGKREAYAVGSPPGANEGKYRKRIEKRQEQ